MRIIVKPGGLIALLITLFGLIVGPLLWLRRGMPQPVQASLPRTSGTSMVTSGNKHPGAPAASASGNLLSDTTWKFYTELDAQAEQSRDVPAEISGAVYHFDVKKIGVNPWNVGFNDTLQDEFHAGETLHLHFRGRSTASSQICMIMQQTAPPFPHCWKEYLTLTPEWKEYDYTFQSSAYPKGGSLFSFFLGFGTGMIELSDIRLERK